MPCATRCASIAALASTKFSRRLPTVDKCSCPHRESQRHWLRSSLPLDVVPKPDMSDKVVRGARRCLLWESPPTTNRWHCFANPRYEHALVDDLDCAVVAPARSPTTLEKLRGACFDVASALARCSGSLRTGSRPGFHRTTTNTVLSSTTPMAKRGDHVPRKCWESTDESCRSVVQTTPAFGEVSQTAPEIAPASAPEIAPASAPEPAPVPAPVHARSWSGGCARLGAGSGTD